MSYNDSMESLSNDALKLIKNNQVIGLGSGRAATALVKSLSKLIKLKNYNIKGIPTSLQIKLVAEKAGIPLVESDQVNHIDIVFDGADQIDSQKYVIKGGGGALLRENILGLHRKPRMTLAVLSWPGPVAGLWRMLSIKKAT